MTCGWFYVVNSLPFLSPSGGLETPFMLTFRSLRYNIHQKMKNLMTKL